jgi:hypothetical protein
VEIQFPFPTLEGEPFPSFFATPHSSGEPLHLHAMRPAIFSTDLPLTACGVSAFLLAFSPLSLDRILAFRDASEFLLVPNSMRVVWHLDHNDCHVTMGLECYQDD